jgi:hypothetical protein
MAVSKYSDNLWADEMGIDLDELAREHPSHPDQLRMKRVITRNAEAYWARERFLARLEYRSEAILPDTTPEPEAKPRKKRAKVNGYEFTDRQLEIARAVLNARNPL